MSPDEQNIVGFVKLIESEPFLFSSSDQTSLRELVAHLPNDIAQISNAIAEWCKSRNQILNSLMPLIANVSKDNDSQTRAVTRKVKSPDPKDYYDILSNAVRVGFPDSTPQQPPNQNPSNSQS